MWRRHATAIILAAAAAVAASERAEPTAHFILLRSRVDVKNLMCVCFFRDGVVRGRRRARWASQTATRLAPRSRAPRRRPRGRGAPWAWPSGIYVALCAGQ